MKCSDCSAVLKPVVAIDVDGTLGDYHTHFLRFAAAYLARFELATDNSYDGSVPFSHWFDHAWGVDLSSFRQMKLAYRQGAMKRSMPVYRGAAQLVANMRFMGAEVWLTTTRPYLRLDNVDPDTRFWLERNGIVFDGLLYDEDKYAVLADRVDRERVVAVLDDLPEQFDAAQEQFGPDVPLLRRNRYNRAITRCPMPPTLEQAGDLIANRIGKWNIRHGSH